jgi:anti-sigma factor RsiW
LLNVDCGLLKPLNNQHSTIHNQIAMANTENIEAKLCAYVDGELDAAGRAEIEAHLVANPQHRQLMDELMGQRQLLRDLPRAAAPGDLLETVNSQLERSALLDAAGERRPDIAGRISPWPKIMSVAAVLTMAIGLFAVIYYVLPQNSGKNREYATGVTRTRAPAAASTARSLVSKDATTQPFGEPTTPALADADLPRGKAATSDEADRARKLDNQADTFAAAKGGAATSQPDVFDKAGPYESKGYVSGANLTNIFADAETEEKIKRSDAVPTDSLVMVVASADPSQAQGSVQKYLEDNKIRWEPVTEKVPQLDLKQSQVLTGSRLGQTQMKLKGGDSSTDHFAGKGGGGAGIGAGSGTYNLKDQEAARSKAEAAGTPTVSQTLPPPPQQADQSQQQQIALAPAAAPPPNPASPKIASNAAPQPAFDLGAGPGAIAATAPAQEQQQAGSIAPQREALQQRVEQVQQPGLELQQVQQQQQQQPSGNSSQLIVARGLTRRQVSELNDNLSTQNAGRVYNYRRSGDNFLPAKDLTIAQTPAVPATPAAPLATPTTVASATTQPADVSRKMKTMDDAASINGFDRAKSAAPGTVAATAPSGGQESAAADTLLAEKPREDLKKTDSSAAAGATTRPAAVSATTSPAGISSLAVVAGPATHPADERLDVVICIQPPAQTAITQQSKIAGGAAPTAATAPSLNAPGAVAPNAAVGAPTTGESTAPNDTPPTDDAK